MELQRLADLSATDRAALIDRDAGIDEARGDVREIIAQVKTDGDAALRTFAAQFDDVNLESIELTETASAAYDRLSPELTDAIDTAIANVRSFHRRQLRDDWRVTTAGRELGRRFRPIEHVGAYVPGGTAAYPSSAIMSIVPAVVAGVEDIAVVTPPGDPPSDVTLGAIHAAGADRVYAAGGAQGIAALAYGTDTVDPVEKIVGPGNKWVSAAKAEVRGDVAIDFVAGPSEILVVADETADPALVAADLLAQAEHDPNASVVAVCTDRETATAIVTAVEQQLPDRDRAATIRQALANDASGVFLAESLDAATTFAEAYAAEHLSIVTADDEAVLEQIDSAGSVFLGAHTPVAAGDYASGTNHVLPTTGLATVSGGLSVDEFVRPSTVQRLDQAALSELRGTIETLAEAEGLEAHTESIRRRFE